ncbi:molybdenum transport ATP-binding protein ModF [Actinobacillus equuli]|nr:molybdenum transport ATP-binding protein ModF [Actinobacillus equuli]
MNVPLPDSAAPLIQLPPNTNPFELKNVMIRYGEKPLLMI